MTNSKYLQTSWLHSKWLLRPGVLLLALLCSLWLLDRLFPLPQERLFARGSSVVLAADGSPLRAFADEQGVWRYPVALSEVSPLYIEALLNYEDRWFYQHPGVNPFALLRAGWQYLQQGEVVSGGSTLTMQVSRLVDPHQRTVAGKLKQILRALQLEWHYDKDEILNFYLNLAPFGGTIEGVEAASRGYLGKSARHLTRAEAALLAVLPQAPSRLRPDRHPQRAEQYRNKVLGRLLAFGVWSEAQVADARMESVYAQRLSPEVHAPLLARRLQQQTPEQALIHSTINADLQRQLEERMPGVLYGLSPGSSVAILVVENRSMKARAYVGAGEFANPERFGHIDMVRAYRSPGSTLKPFLYGFALDEGLIHSASLLVDAPTGFDGYRPGNFDGGFRGAVSASYALQQSLNVPAVDLLDRIGPAIFDARLRNGGLNLKLPGGARPNLSMILGGVATTLEDLVGSYAALARDGLAARVRYLEQEPLQERRLLSAGAAWIIRQILQEHNRPGLPESVLQMAAYREVAWKTGTSYGFRDTWAIGVTQAHTVGVWIGRPDATPMPGHYGSITAAPVLFDIVDGLSARGDFVVPQPQPDSVSRERICWPLGQGMRADEEGLCQRRLDAWILDDTIPPTLPDRLEPARSLRLSYWSNPQDGGLVPQDCSGVGRERQERARWPLALGPWLSATEREQSSLPHISSQCSHGRVAMARPLRISDFEEKTLLRRATNSLRAPHLKLKALGGYGKRYWLVNGEVKGLTLAEAQGFEYEFVEPGHYTVTVLDEQGASDSIRFYLLDDAQG